MTVGSATPAPAAWACADCGSTATAVLCADDKWRDPDCWRKWLARMKLPNKPIAELKAILAQRERETVSAGARPRRSSAKLNPGRILRPAVACEHPDPIPLGHRAQKHGTTAWGRLGDYCGKCKSVRLGEKGAWISLSAIERLQRQADCLHQGETFATYRRGAVYRNDKGKKVQPWETLGLECADCGADILRAPLAPLAGVAAERVREFTENREKRRR